MCDHAGEHGDNKGQHGHWRYAQIGIVRAILTYPSNVGRSVSEMLRLLRALQAVAGGDAVAPENWQPGDAL